MRKVTSQSGDLGCSSPRSKGTSCRPDESLLALTLITSVDWLFRSMSPLGGTGEWTSEWDISLPFSYSVSIHQQGHRGLLPVLVILHHDSCCVAPPSFLVSGIRSALSDFRRPVCTHYCRRHKIPGDRHLQKKEVCFAHSFET